MQIKILRYGTTAKARVEEGAWLHHEPALEGLFWHVDEMIIELLTFILRIFNF